jgi:hypothetical protein
LTDREHDAERGRGRDVEDGEREGDTGKAVADRRDHRPGEEQTEVALAQGAKALAQRHRHAGRVVAAPCGMSSVEG